MIKRPSNNMMGMIAAGVVMLFILTNAMLNISGAGELDFGDNIGFMLDESAGMYHGIDCGHLIVFSSGSPMWPGVFHAPSPSQSLHSATQQLTQWKFFGIHYLGVKFHLAPADNRWTIAISNWYFVAICFAFVMIFARREEKRRKTLPKGQCKHCGYDCRHTSEKRCPECGKALQQKS